MLVSYTGDGSALPKVDKVVKKIYLRKRIATIDFLVDWKLLYGSLSVQILNSYYSIITKNYRLIFYMSQDGSFIIFLQFFV